MTASQKRNALVLECQTKGFVSTRRAVEMLGGYYFHNGEQYVGQILTRMVRAGTLERVRPGFYRLPIRPQPLEGKTDPNQTTLF